MATGSAEEQCNSLLARVNALEKVLDEREERTKDRLTALQNNVAQALNAADKALTKAENTTESRFQGVNEFREQLRDQAASLMPRAEYNAQHQTMVKQIGDFGTRLNELMPRQEYQLHHTMLTDQTAVLAERLSVLENVQQGKREGLSLVGQVVLACITGTTAIGALIVAILHR